MKRKRRRKHENKDKMTTENKHNTDKSETKDRSNAINKQLQAPTHDQEHPRY